MGTISTTTRVFEQGVGLVRIDWNFGMNWGIDDSIGLSLCREMIYLKEHVSYSEGKLDDVYVEVYFI